MKDLKRWLCLACIKCSLPVFWMVDWCFYHLDSSERWLWEGGAGPPSLWGRGGSSKGLDAAAGCVHAQREGPGPRRLPKSRWLRCHWPVQPQEALLPHGRWLLPSWQGKGERESEALYRERERSAQPLFFFFFLWIKELYPDCFYML